MVFGGTDRAEVIRGSMIGLTIGTDIPLEADLCSRRDKNDLAVPPARGDRIAFFGMGVGAYTAFMPATTTDEALTSEGIRGHAFLKGRCGSGGFTRIGVVTRI